MADKDKDVVKEIGNDIVALQDTMKDISTEVKSFKEQVDSLGGEDQEKIEKIEKSLEKLDEKQQALVLDKTDVENEKKALLDRIENLEGQVIKKVNAENIPIKETNEYKAMQELVKSESMQAFKSTELYSEHKDYLRTDVGEFGGFLVPEMIAEDLLKQVTDISEVRRLARVRTTRTKTLNVPIRTTLPTATYEGEAEVAPVSTSKYISETMTAHRQHTIVPVTRDQLNFTNFNMESEITTDAMIAFAAGEGLNFISGDGVKKPEGILERSGAGANDIETIAASTGGALKLDDVIELVGFLKAGYANPKYFFNRKTLTQLRTEKDANGNYLWTFGGERFPTVINGFDYVIMQDMPDVANDALSVGVGDFFRGYNILDSLQMELIRDNVTRKSEAIVEFSWNRFNDGRVVLGEAFKLLDIGSS